MKEYEIRVRKTVFGKAIVEAENEEEAREKFQNGEEKSFESSEDDYPQDFIIDEVEEIESED